MPKAKKKKLLVLYRCPECKQVLAEGELTAMGPGDTKPYDCPRCCVLCVLDPKAKKLGKFDPHRDFKSPKAALAYAECFPDPKKTMLKIVHANIDMAEYGFASECVSEMECLEFDADE